MPLFILAAYCMVGIFTAFVYEKDKLLGPSFSRTQDDSFVIGFTWPLTMPLYLLMKLKHLAMLLPSAFDYYHQRKLELEDRRHKNTMLELGASNKLLAESTED